VRNSQKGTLTPSLKEGSQRRLPRWPPLISTFIYMYIIFSVQAVPILLNLSWIIETKVSTWMLLEQITVIWKLNYFTVVCNIMGPLKQWTLTAAIWRCCLIVLLWIALKILLHHIDQFYILRYLFWYFQNDMASGAKPGVLSPDLGFSMSFWVFLLKFKCGGEGSFSKLTLVNEQRSTIRKTRWTAWYQTV